jgi:acyl carrier protein
MTDDPLLARVHAVVAGVAGAARARGDEHPDTPLGASGFWLDSLDLVEVVVACEHEFGVTFDGERDVTPESLASIRSLAALIRSKGGR